MLNTCSIHSYPPTRMPMSPGTLSVATSCSTSIGTNHGKLCWVRGSKAFLMTIPPSQNGCSSSRDYLDQLGTTRNPNAPHSYLEARKEAGNMSRVAQTLRLLSDINWWLGLHEEGMEQAKEALKTYERLGDPVRQARCSNELAWSLLSTGQLEAAENAASRAIGFVSEEGKEYTQLLSFAQGHSILYVCRRSVLLSYSPCSSFICVLYHVARPHLPSYA